MIDHKYLITFGFFIEILMYIVLPVQGIPVEKWFKLNDSLTIFVEREYRYNWFQARNECLLKNMTLLTVDTSEKSAALTVLLKRIFAKSHNLWLGGDDLAKQGTFVWSTTGKPFEFTNWSQGNPSHNHGLEHCVNLWAASDFEWNDAPCSERKGFICEENRFVTGARRDVEAIKNAILQYYGYCDK